MTPRSHKSPAVKPSSVRPYVDTVRNVHLRRGITLAPAPVVSRVLKGMLKNYVRVHGTDALIPTRKEPIENHHCAAMYAVGRSTPVRVGRHTVSWRTPRCRCFKALLNGLRQTGGRRAHSRGCPVGKGHERALALRCHSLAQTLIEPRQLLLLLRVWG